MVETGITNRIPSAEAISPPPQAWGVGKTAVTRYTRTAAADGASAEQPGGMVQEAKSAV
jgi:hypothetical protein